MISGRQQARMNNLEFEHQHIFIKYECEFEESMRRIKLRSDSDDPLDSMEAEELKAKIKDLNTLYDSYLRSLVKLDEPISSRVINTTDLTITGATVQTLEVISELTGIEYFNPVFL